MDNRAVGILEVYGLVCAFMAADAGCKAANVTLDPFDKNKVCAKVPIRGSGAMATSGNMERFVTIDGKQYGHIMDPVTGYPVSDRISVTVLTGTGVESDVLSTSIFVKGYSFAGKAGQAVTRARESLANLINAQMDEIYQVCPPCHPAAVAGGLHQLRSWRSCLLQVHLSLRHPYRRRAPVACR